MVLTSERRGNAEQRDAIDARLEKYGLGKMLGWTNKLGLSGTRAEEILEWLTSREGEVTHWVAVDDWDLVGPPI